MTVCTAELHARLLKQSEFKNKLNIDNNKKNPNRFNPYPGCYFH